MAWCGIHPPRIEQAVHPAHDYFTADRGSRLSVPRPAGTPVHTGPANFWHARSPAVHCGADPDRAGISRVKRRTNQTGDGFLGKWAKVFIAIHPFAIDSYVLIDISCRRSTRVSWGPAAAYYCRSSRRSFFANVERAGLMTRIGFMPVSAHFPYIDWNNMLVVDIQLSILWYRRQPHNLEFFSLIDMVRDLFYLLGLPGKCCLNLHTIQNYLDII